MTLCGEKRVGESIPVLDLDPKVLRNLKEEYQG